MKKNIAIAACLLLGATTLGQAPTPQQPQRQQLTAEKVFDGMKEDLSACAVDKSTIKAALAIEQKYAHDLEIASVQKDAKIRELEQRLGMENK